MFVKKIKGIIRGMVLKRTAPATRAFTNAAIILTSILWNEMSKKIKKGKKTAKMLQRGEEN